MSSGAEGNVVSRAALWVLAAFVLSIPPEGVVTLPGIGSVSRLMGVAVLGAGLLSLYQRGSLRFRVPSLFLVVAAFFFAWSAVTFFWSVAPATTMSRTVTFAQMAVLVWLVHQLVRKERDLDLLYQGFVIGCMVLIGVGAAVFFGEGGYRDVGSTNANDFARVSALGIPMAWSLAMGRSRGLLRALNLAYPAFALFAVIIAASRGGLVTATVAMMIVPALASKLRPLARLALVALAVAVTWGSFTTIPAAFPELQRNVERLAELDEQLLEGGTLTGRTVIWAAGLEVFHSAPVVGVGAAGFTTAVEPFLGSARSAHNTLLSVAADTGLIGLTLYLLLIVISLVGILAHAERRLEHLVLLGTLAVGMLVTSADNDKYSWFILAGFAAVRPVLLLVRPSSPGPRSVVRQPRAPLEGTVYVATALAHNSESLRRARE